MANVHARELRKNLTDAEQRLWQKLKRRQIATVKFRRQQPIGHFIADFVCHESCLIVEVDGEQHANGITDIRRTACLESHGYRVLRFWNNEIINEEEAVMARIFDALHSPLPNPSPARGEGLVGASNG